MISLLVPSRGRPQELQRLWLSARETAKNPEELEIIVRLDWDDPSNYPEPIMSNMKYRIGDRVVLSECWNECYQDAQGPIYMHCGDDIIFRTQDWDAKVRQAFKECEDKILFVHGHDGFQAKDFGTHGFLHEEWVKAVGYFVPPYFSSDYNDTWLNDVANAIDRRKYVPIYTEHMHFVNGKSEIDKTHTERLQRHKDDDVDTLYYTSEMGERRVEDALKLTAAIEGSKS